MGYVNFNISSAFRSHTAKGQLFQFFNVNCKHNAPHKGFGTIGMPEATILYLVYYSHLQYVVCIVCIYEYALKPSIH